MSNVRPILIRYSDLEYMNTVYTMTRLPDIVTGNSVIINTAVGIVVLKKQISFKLTTDFVWW